MNFVRNLFRIKLLNLTLVGRKPISSAGGYHRQSNTMNVIPIAALSDNYMYLIVDQASGECAAVDPVEPGKVYR
jgi:hypothetical protein